MKLSGVEYQKLVESIVQAYPTKNDLAQIVMYSLEENIDAIVNSETTTQSIVFNLINWAETRGKLKNLLEIISQERPDNVELQNTIKNLLEKYSQDNKINSKDDQDNHKKNKLSSFIKLFLGILIIPVGIMSYQISQQPRLSCNDTELQKQDDSIKIVIPDFEGSPDPDLKTYLPDLKTYLFEKLKTEIKNHTTLTICQVNKKPKDSLEANDLRNKLFPKNPNSVLVIWGNMSESGFSGGIINDKSDNLLLDVPLHQKDKLIFKDSLFTTLDIKINYAVALIFFRQNKTWESQTLLAYTLARSIDCKIKNEKLVRKLSEESPVLNLEQLSKSYDILGDLYKKNKRFDMAVESYQCSYDLEKNLNQKNILLLKLAETYSQDNNFEKASLSYQKVIDNGSDPLKNRALVSRAMMFADRGECHKAEQELYRVVEENLDRLNGLDIRSKMRFFKCSNILDAIKDLSEFCIVSNARDCQKNIDFIIQVITTEYNKQEYQKIVSELEEIKQAHPEWQKIIDKLLKHR
jgi:tetratricopeptide (TPR) repeat protein